MIKTVVIFIITLGLAINMYYWLIICIIILDT